MADNDTFRYLGGLGLTNLFSVHVRMGVYDLYYLEPVLGFEAILDCRDGFFVHFLGAQTRLLKPSKNLKTMVLAI